MNNEIMQNAGFGGEVALVSLGRCPICTYEVFDKDFTDQLSRKEYSISGLCQKCQDKMFTEPKEC